MKTYSRLTLAFLLLILVVPQVGADEEPKDGKHVTYFDNGEKFSETNYKNGYEHGLETYWHKNGQKETEQNWLYGTREGLETHWYASGQKKSEAHWKNSKLDGLKTKWDKNGQKEYEEHWKNGKEEGLSAYWYYNGQKKKERHYKNGEKDGVWTEWYENGQKKEERHYKNDERDGPLTSWHENGHRRFQENYKEGILQDDLKIEWYANGQKRSEVNYKEGKKDGLATTWYDNGRKKSQKNFEDGELVSASAWKPDGKVCPLTSVADGSGVLCEYYKNNQRESEKNITKNKPDGLQREWYANGQKKSEVNYKEGKKDGLDATWYDNGRKKLEGRYKKEERDGVWTEWYENGQKKCEKNFEDGELVSASSWKPDGTICPYTNITDGSGHLMIWHEDGKKRCRYWYEPGEIYHYVPTYWEGDVEISEEDFFKIDNLTALNGEDKQSEHEQSDLPHKWTNNAGKSFKGYFVGLFMDKSQKPPVQIVVFKRAKDNKEFKVPISRLNEVSQEFALVCLTQQNKSAIKNAKLKQIQARLKKIGGVLFDQDAFANQVRDGAAFSKLDVKNYMRRPPDDGTVSQGGGSWLYRGTFVEPTSHNIYKTIYFSFGNNNELESWKCIEADRATKAKYRIKSKAPALEFSFDDGASLFEGRTREEIEEFMGGAPSQVSEGKNGTHYRDLRRGVAEVPKSAKKNLSKTAQKDLSNLLTSTTPSLVWTYSGRFTDSVSELTLNRITFSFFIDSKTGKWTVFAFKID